MKKLLLSATFALFITAAFSQKVSTELKFPKGAKIQVVTTISNTAEIMGEINTSITSTRMLDIESVNEGIATIESKIKRLQFNFEGMGQSQSFDSEKESDMKGEGGKMAEKGLKNKYSMKVDPSGKILEVKADEDNPNVNVDSTAAADSDPMSSMMEGVMGGMDLPKAGDKLDLAIFPGNTIEKGQSWTNKTEDPKEIQRTATYTVTNITDEEITVEFSEESSGKMVRQNMGMEITIDQTEKTKGQIIVSRTTGLVKSRKSTKTSEGTMEVMGQTMPLNTKTTITETVTIQ